MTSVSGSATALVNNELNLIMGKTIKDREKLK